MLSLGSKKMLGTAGAALWEPLVIQSELRNRLFAAVLL